MKPKIIEYKDEKHGIIDGHSITLTSKDGKQKFNLQAYKANVIIENLEKVKDFANAYKQ